MDLYYFKVNNKSGYKTNEKWFSKNHPEEYDKIISYCQNMYQDMSFREKIWFYFNKLTERPKCVGCGETLKFQNRFDNAYLDFCTLSCFNGNKEEMVKRQKKTFQERYGVDFYPQTKSFAGKVKETKKLRYGNPNYVNPTKSKETRLLKYGNENYNNMEKNRQTCQERYGFYNFALTPEFKDLIKKKYAKIYEQYDIKNVDNKTVDILCELCGSLFTIKKQLLYERNVSNQTICVNCNPEGIGRQSNSELEIMKYLLDNNVRLEKLKKIGSSKMEIDLFLPDYNLAIEFNGLYWHSDKFRDKNYHLNKTKECLKQNINLIHIFEDEWKYKKDIVLSILNNRININGYKIFARNCDVKLISNKICSDFLDSNHIQGKVNCKVNIGLFHKDELVSVMTFSKGRLALNANKEEWEMVRFCNKLNTTIVGGASKLFKYFLNSYEPTIVNSFSDIRYFDGKLYEKLGFSKISTTKPNYWYITNNKRLHRFNFTKSKLIKEGFDPSKTEFEIMAERKILKIYDCGNVKWKYVKMM
jgi:hypothetical protein